MIIFCKKCGKETRAVVFKIPYRRRDGTHCHVALCVECETIAKQWIK